MKKSVKIIFHVDMDAFFCTVEEIFYPFLKGKPFVISSRISTKGIVSTASYPARKYGIHSAMSKMDALRLCPELIVVDSHYWRYSEYSKKFMNVLKEYSSIIEQASVDEAYIDMTELSKKRHPVEIAKEIQERLKNEYQLSCSIGIGPNLFLAKMGSDYKKPMGITVIRKRDIEKMLYDLPIGAIFGVGKKSQISFKKINIEKIRDFVEYKDKDYLRSYIGELSYNSIIEKLSGNTSDVVNCQHIEKQSSISHAHTFIHPMWDEDEIKEGLLELSGAVARHLASNKQVAKTISLQIKYTDFKNFVRGKTIDVYTDDVNKIYSVIEDIFDGFWSGESIRLLGVNASNLIDKGHENIETNLFNLVSAEREQKLENAILNMKKKYGEDVFVKKKKS